MAAIEHWRQRVEAHHAQSIEVQAGAERPQDFWRPFASAFRADPRRADDPVLERLVRNVSSEQTLLDVGGGAGRLALPLALRCRHVTVVEPSESMVAELREGMRQAEIGNLSVVQASWEDARVEPADVALCAHVLYGVADVAPFIRKLEAHARERALVLMFMDSPQARLSPFWKRVHREERIDLPALPELLEVLWEMEIFPDLEMAPTASAREYESREGALEELRRRLYVAAGTDRDRRLRRAARELLVETPEGLAVKGAQPRRLGLLSWRPR